MKTSTSVERIPLRREQCEHREVILYGGIDSTSCTLNHNEIRPTLSGTGSLKPASQKFRNQRKLPDATGRNQTGFRDSTFVTDGHRRLPSGEKQRTFRGSPHDIMCNDLCKRNEKRPCIRAGDNKLKTLTSGWLGSRADEGRGKLR